MDLHFLSWQTGQPGGRGLSESWHLRSYPDIAAAWANMNGAVHRLHGSVCEEWHLVNRLDLLGGARHSLRGITLLARDHARTL